MNKCKEIIINGIVQGVGFRPYIFNLAKENNLNGYILNRSNGVQIFIEGKDSAINSFINTLKSNPPTLSKIEQINIYSKELMNFSSFQIKKSKFIEDSQIFISPDVCTCNECLEDILDETNSRYFYPFTNCTNCGPRFSIIKASPYDRYITTMSKFNMCSNCKNEYENIHNRRFHAQPNCCPECGPKIFILDNNGEDISERISTSSDYNKSLLSFFGEKIIDGKIFAIKSLSGFHLCCNPFLENTIGILRTRKHRPSKPFALMMKDMYTIKKYCYVNKDEEKALLSKERPIVLLRKRSSSNFPPNLAPNNSLLGVMLPSNPLHFLLFRSCNLDSLVMTSGNFSGNPLEYKNNLAFENLKYFSDYFLMNNRDIYLPLDDSIIKVTKHGQMIIRRSRGYCPLPLRTENNGSILAMGSDMKNSFAISKENYLYLGPHNGDLITYESIERYKENILHYIKLFEVSPKFITYDKHPAFISSKLGAESSLNKITVYHHHAHIVSCMADNNYRKKVIGVAFDGTGYGNDNAIWGSEFLICNEKDFKRVGHLEYVNILGGDDSLKDLYKTALSYLYNINDESFKILNTKYKECYEIIFKLLESQKFSYKSSSMGRLFDAVASLLNLCQKASFEGEGAIALESILKKYTPSNSYNIKLIDNNGCYELSPTEIIREVLYDINNGTSPSSISLKFHSTIVKYITVMCKFLRDDYNINCVALSGGVFQNSFILNNSIELLENLGFKVLTHKNIPPNDGGIAVGQIIIAKNNI